MRKTAIFFAAVAGLAAAASPCWAAVFVSDNFEYASSTALTAAGWVIDDTDTVVDFDATWRLATGDQSTYANYYPPTTNGSPGSTSGKFLLSKSTTWSLVNDSQYDWAQDRAHCDSPDTGASHDIYTPQFNTTGSSNVWLHADIGAMLNQEGKACFFIEVSNDGGATWDMAFERVCPGRDEPGHFDVYPPTTTYLPTSNNADGYFGRLDLDLSPWAANSAEVKVRFRHYEPWSDWAVRLDNVLIDDKPVVHGNTTIFEEYFNNPNAITEDLRNPPFDAAYEWVGGMQKAGWHESFGGDGLWVTWHATGPRTFDEFGQYGDEVRGQNRWVNRLEHSYHPGDGDAAGFNPNPDYAFIDCVYTSSSTNTADEYLMTPLLDCTDVTNVMLGYQDEIWWYTGNGTCIAEVLLIQDVDHDGQEPNLNFEGYVTDDVVVKTIFSYDQNAIGPEDGEDPWYAERMLSVPELDGTSDMYIAWHYKAYNAPWWAIDSIKISGTGPGTEPHMGDANNDGFVNDLDAAIIAAHWHVQSGAVWADGDFNADGKVDDKDASILAVNWLWSATAEGDASVPEPSTLALLLGAAAMAWLGYRRGR